MSGLRLEDPGDSLVPKREQNSDSWSISTKRESKARKMTYTHGLVTSPHPEVMDPAVSVGHTGTEPGHLASASEPSRTLILGKSWDFRSQTCQ